MDRLPDVYPVSHFRQNTLAHLKRLSKSGRPTLLTQNGHAAAVLLSQASYDALVTQAARAAKVAAVQEALDERGPGYSLAQARSMIARSLRRAGPAPRRGGR